MTQAALRVKGLSKQYRIGTRKKSYETLYDVLARGLKGPFHWLQGKRSLGPGPNNHIWALKDVSFEVKEGEIVGIIGRNGAGKSTLLKVLSRITEPTRGHAELRGRVASLLEVGTGFHRELTGRENIYLNGTILGMKRREINRRFDEIVSFAEIEKFIDTPVKYYSSGMSVRLAFAVAAHLDPEILLIDEVLAVGDTAFQEKCLGKIGDVGRKGRTVLVVSHNMAAIANLCQRALLLNSGQVEKEGPPSEVVQHYLSALRETGGEVVWPDPKKAPGNDLVRLESVRILQGGVESPTADVDISKEILIQIRYWNLQEGTRLYSAIWLRDQMGTVVLTSGSHRSISLTEDFWYGKPHPTGLFQSVCRIPANFLNEGLYSVSAIVGLGIADTQIFEDYALSFRVHDTGEMRKEFYGGWIGTVRPRLAWQTEYMEPPLAGQRCDDSQKREN